MPPQNTLPPQNRLLAALPPTVFQRLQPHLQDVSLTIHQPIYDEDLPIPYVYFPDTALVSLVITMLDGVTMEAGMVGQEGMVGIPLLLGGTTRTHRAFVQVAGQAKRLEAAVLKAEFDQGGELQRLLLRYFQVLLSQVSQTAACNRFHSTDRRLARWLLMVSTAISADEFFLTQEFIGQMVGVQRAGVTVAASKLAQEGLIRYSRGKISILDRPQLEKFSCECYALVRNEVDRLLK